MAQANINKGALGSISKQSGFLMGFNRSAGGITLGQNQFSLDGGVMAALSEQGSSRASVEVSNDAAGWGFDMDIPDGKPVDPKA